MGKGYKYSKKGLKFGSPVYLGCFKDFQWNIQEPVAQQENAKRNANRDVNKNQGDFLIVKIGFLEKGKKGDDVDLQGENGPAEQKYEEEKPAFDRQAS